MERERFNSLLNDPAGVDREDLASLRDLTERNPWFAAGQLLLASGEHTLGDVHYDSTLRNAVAHLPARSALFDVVHDMRPMKVPAPLRVIPKELESTSMEQTGTTDQFNEVPIVVDARPGSKEPERKEDDRDLLDDEMRRAAFASSYELLMEHAPERAVPPPVDKPRSEEVVSSSDVDPPIQLVGPDPTKRMIEERIEPVPADHVGPSSDAVVPPPIGGRMRFTQWLLEGSGLHAERELDRSNSAPGRTEQLPEPDPSNLGSSTDSKTLVDRFIKQTLPEPIARKAFFTPQEAAKRSLDDTAGMVTETLARIYEKQGNTAKAIEAYHKLALKYPDKSAYFAALSKALEGQ